MVFKIYLYLVIIFFVLPSFFACESGNSNSVQTEQQSNQNKVVAINKDSTLKTQFSELLNQRSFTTLAIPSVSNLDSINGFRNVIIGTHIDYFTLNYDLSELKEHYYSSYSNNLKILYLESNMDFGTIEDPFSTEITTTLYFWNNILCKIIISYNCSTLLGKDCNIPDWLDSLTKVFGKYQEEEKSECEKRTDEEYKRLKRSIIESVTGHKISKYKNCKYTYFWMTKKISLVLNNKYSVRENAISHESSNKNDPYHYYSDIEMSIEIFLQAKIKLIEQEIDHIEAVIQKESRYYQKKSDSIKRAKDFRETVVNF